MSLESVIGVGPKTAEKLVSGGISTVDELSVQRPQEVTSILGCSVKAAKEMINSAKELAFQDTTIYTAKEYGVKMKSLLRTFKTGSSKLDELLGGGWRTMSTYGLFGPFHTGKTQLCNTAIVNCVADGKYALFIETESNTFSSDRLIEIAKATKVDIDLDKVILYPALQVGTVYAQFRGYEFLAKKAIENNWDVGVIVVDSFCAKFRRAFSGREMFPERAQEFGRHLDFLEEMGKKFNAAILLTLQVGVTPDDAGTKGDLMRYQSEYYPYGGTLVAHNVNTWLSLNQVKGGAKSTDVYEANLADSSWLPKGSCQFIISDRGVEEF